MAVVEHAAGTGLSFELSDEQKALRELAREFAEKEIRPKAAEYDEHPTHAAEILAKAHEVGLMNLHVPSEYGGPGLSLFEGALVNEELCWGCAGIGTSITCSGLGAGPILDRRQRRAEADVARRPLHRGAAPLLVRPDRARRRLGRRPHEVDGRAEGR